MFKKLLVVFVLALGLGFLGYRIYEAVQSQQVAGAGSGMSRPVITVQTVPADLRDFQETVELMGELRPQLRVDVMPRISGRMERLHVEKGDRVETGLLLAELDDRELRQQVDRANASLRVAQAGLAQQKATIDNLISQRNRLEQLYTAQLVARQDLEDLQSRVRAAEAQLDLQQAQIEAAQASLSELEIQLDQTRLYSPLSGFVGERLLDPGAMVSPNAPILTLVDLSRLKTVAAAPESQLRHLRLGQQVRVVVDAFPDERFEGTIARIAPILDPATRTAEVEILIPNRADLLRAGMFARVQILVGESRGLAVPRSSIVNRQERSGVFVVDDEVARFVEVRAGPSQGGLVQIINGLEAGRQVISAGAQFLNDGDEVRVQNLGSGR